MNLMNLRPWLLALTELAIPAICPACRAETLRPGQPLCPGCHSRLPLNLPPFCPDCGGTNDGILERCADCLRATARPWHHAIAVMRLEGFGRELIHRFKYRKQPELARPFGLLAAQRWRESGRAAPDLLVPMPLHWTRQLQRGYNQAALLAEVMGGELALPVRQVLRRTRRTRAQARLNREARQRNLAGAFCVSGQALCQNRSILLLDDVLTTGATLAAAATALRQAGAREIGILILARD